ncbi:MAG: EscU/YscU/HrcU family type III secretion system export apparatus switch protein, partial [Hydrogenimonas sp.]|nr:EscU/YscU/HrcU family type III secretion system export apparatus switch protein [Hydrogenimonas sp.]
MLRPKAAALRYDPKKDGAPKVVASGRGEVALKIIEKAKEFDITLFQTEEMAEVLVK